MKSVIIAATAAAVALPTVAATPAIAAGPREVRQEQRECQRELRRADNRREYNRELRECRREVGQAQRDVRRNQRERLRDWRQARRYDWNRVEPGTGRYYADRYYRSGSYYADRRLSRYDRVYRGYDGRYYCRRNDGTTGLIIGAGIGALLGNQLNIGGSTTLSTVLGGAAGALLGKEIAQGQLRCD
jgi:hypothetical protein